MDTVGMRPELGGAESGTDSLSMVRVQAGEGRGKEDEGFVKRQNKHTSNIVQTPELNGHL